ncbi:toll-like receptor 2 [Haliotis rubra]|uniref:toll-like receptor 2 n=1 Tax=Haliotis rubra TaxID=36100 RepID=UPI001EE5CFC1|nr:toll-like receptor 2 [Haliotis rubra]
MKEFRALFGLNIGVRSRRPEGRSCNAGNRTRVPSCSCEYNEDRLQYVPRLQWAGDIYGFAFLHNHLKTITNSTFQNVSQYTLYLLDLTHNHIAHISAEMGRLKELHLSENSIQDIQNNFFDSNHHLRKLSLANNSIKTLSRLAFSNSVRKELHHVHLENNPFVCNCDLFWLKYWLLSETTKFSNHLSKYTCSNVPFQGKNLVDITSINGSDCSETRKRFSIVYCIVGTVLICLCFFGLGYRFRWNIRYCCLTYKSSASESIPLLRNDVYILYSDEDYLWVRYEALDKLENEGKQKVCFRQRDFNPKKYVVDNVVTNLRRCRKVIAVLSNSFFKDRASQFEMSLVRKRLERHKEILVLVLLEDIENRYMSHSVNRMMQACLTIKWSEMNDERDAFWEQLLTHV